MEGEKAAHGQRKIQSLPLQEAQKIFTMTFERVIGLIFVYLICCHIPLVYTQKFLKI
jgi:hypothetical protein